MFAFGKAFAGAVCFVAVGALHLSAAEFKRSNAPARERLLVHINGLSCHFSSERDRLNELNHGLGLSYHLGTIESGSRLLDGVRVFAEADVYSDSFSDLGFLFGASFQRRLFGRLDWGVNIGLIHEDNLQEKSGLYLFPYLFPFVQTTVNTRINARILFVPPVHNDGIIALQLIVRL